MENGLTRCLTRAASVKVPDWDYSGVSTSLCACKFWGPRFPVWNRRIGFLVTHGLLVCSQCPSHPESKVESWCQPGYSSVGRHSGGLGDIVELATAVLWDAPTRKEAFRRRKAKRRSLGHPRPQGARQDHKDCSCMCFVCFVGPSTRVASGDSKSPQKAHVQGSQDFAVSRRRWVVQNRGERGSGSIPSTWSECCPPNRSRCTAKKKDQSQVMQEIGSWVLNCCSPLP